MDTDEHRWEGGLPWHGRPAHVPRFEFDRRNHREHRGLREENQRQYQVNARGMACPTFFFSVLSVLSVASVVFVILKRQIWAGRPCHGRPPSHLCSSVSICGDYSPHFFASVFALFAASRFSATRSCRPTAKTSPRRDLLPQFFQPLHGNGSRGLQFLGKEGDAQLLDEPAELDEVGVVLAQPLKGLRAGLVVFP
jgi:hypothetical protein